MTPEKIISVIEIYEKQLVSVGVPKARINPELTFRDVSREQLLQHAHYLCDGVKELAKDPKKKRKVGSHLTAVQMCLSFAGWYTIEELMEHNRPA